LAKNGVLLRDRITPRTPRIPITATYYTIKLNHLSAPMDNAAAAVAPSVQIKNKVRRRAHTANTRRKRRD
jgi:hypothetical protein